MEDIIYDHYIAVDWASVNMAIEIGDTKTKQKQRGLE